MLTKDNAPEFSETQLKYMNREVTDLLDVWDIEPANPEYDNYVEMAEKRIIEKNSPENLAKLNRQREKSNNGYRRAKVRR